MRVRHFPISCEAIAYILATGAEHNFRVAHGLPADARVRGAFTEGDKIVIVAESREFENVLASQAPAVRGILIEDRRAPAPEKARALALS